MILICAQILCDLLFDVLRGEYERRRRRCVLWHWCEDGDGERLLLAIGLRLV